jgi:hypothetical protein
MQREAREAQSPSGLTVREGLSITATKRCVLKTFHSKLGRTLMAECRARREERENRTAFQQHQCFIRSSEEMI